MATQQPTVPIIDPRHEACRLFEGTEGHVAVRMVRTSRVGCPPSRGSGCWTMCLRHFCRIDHERVSLRVLWVPLATMVKIVAPAIRSAVAFDGRATLMAETMTRPLTLMSFVVKIQLAWRWASGFLARRRMRVVAMFPAKVRSGSWRRSPHQRRA